MPGKQGLKNVRLMRVRSGEPTVSFKASQRHEEKSKNSLQDTEALVGTERYKKHSPGYSETSVKSFQFQLG